jgi:hypothetical protein
MHIAATIIAALALVSLSAAAATQPLPRPRPAEASGVEPNLRNFGDLDPTCTYWSDFCHSCIRAADGAPSCNSIGSSCVPREVRCMRWHHDMPLQMPERQAR